MASSLEILRNVTTGTITTMLLKKGIRHSWMAGAMPFGFTGKRVVGPAFTLRFVPVREDLHSGKLVETDFNARSDRGDAGELRCRGGCDGRDRRRHIR